MKRLLFPGLLVATLFSLGACGDDGASGADEQASGAESQGDASAGDIAIPAAGSFLSEAEKLYGGNVGLVSFDGKGGCSAKIVSASHLGTMNLFYVSPEAALTDRETLARVQCDLDTMHSQMTLWQKAKFEYRIQGGKLYLSDGKSTLIFDPRDDGPPDAG